MGGGGEYWRPQERSRLPEARFEIEPGLHRRLWTKNKLISQLYNYASGHSPKSPDPQVTTPKAAMATYLDLTVGTLPQPPVPTIPPPITPTEILFYDPFSDHKFRLNEDDRANAADLLASMYSDGTQTRPIVSTVDTALTKFIEDFSELPDVSKADKLDVVDRLENTGLISFGKSVLVLVSRYLALMKKRGR